MSTTTISAENFTSILSNSRPGPALEHAADQLGPLADLAGTWIGTGFNLIALPAFSQKQEFRLQLNNTVEVLEFEPIGAQVPNRGSFSGKPKPNGQPDINIYGLRYLQRVADGKNHQPLHVEPGFWLNVPATHWPELGASVVRQGVIPHGNSLLALGSHSESDGKPEIPKISSIPARHDGTDFPDPSYVNPYKFPPEGVDAELVKNPNLALEKALKGQDVTNTVTLEVGAKNPQKADEDPESRNGRIASIPFIAKNADVKQFKSIFWIEKVRNPDNRGVFLQLQYTQLVILDFLDIDWPHISVATLIKQ